jgi:hypothetical protein
MQEQMNDTVGLVTLEAAQPIGWQTVAIEEYERFWPIREADLRTDLSARMLALTGRLVSPEDIYTDGQLAVAGVDGATFRLYQGGDLILVRTCSYCGTGHFESPKISKIPDLGYALSAWRPLHEDCEDFSAEDLPDF